MNIHQDHIIIEVSGGCITNIVSNMPVSITIIDHDNLREGQDVEDIATYAPDAVLTNEELKQQFEETVSEYR